MTRTSDSSEINNLFFNLFLIAYARVKLIHTSLAYDFAAPFEFTVAPFQSFYPERAMSTAAAHDVARVVALRGFVAESEKLTS